MNKKGLIVVIGVTIVIILSLFSGIRLLSLSNSIENSKGRIQSIQNQIDGVDNKIEEKSNQISTLENEIDQVKKSLSENTSKVNKLQSTKRYELHNPSSSEVKSFIKSDKTDEKEYDEVTFTCANFAQEINNNAEDAGFRCGYVEITLVGEEDHACVVFNTTDKGMLYYEPIYDLKVDLQIGKDYWAECIQTPSGYYFPADPASVVEDFSIYW